MVGTITTTIALRGSEVDGSRGHLVRNKTHFKQRFDMSDDTKYVISIPLDDEPGEFETLGFPDLDNMYGFLNLLSENGLDVSRIILPEGSLV